MHACRNAEPKTFGELSHLLGVAHHMSMHDTLT